MGLPASRSEWSYFLVAALPGRVNSLEEATPAVTQWRQGRGPVSARPRPFRSRRSTEVGWALDSRALRKYALAHRKPTEESDGGFDGERPCGGPFSTFGVWWEEFFGAKHGEGQKKTVRGEEHRLHLMNSRGNRWWVARAVLPAAPARRPSWWTRGQRDAPLPSRFFSLSTMWLRKLN